MIDTSLRPILTLFKNFDDQTFTPFTTYCNLSPTCPTIKSASSTPDNFGGACPPGTFASYGMSGYVCYVGNSVGNVPAGREADIIYNFTLPSGNYFYSLVFRYLAYGSDGYDGSDTAVAEALLAGSTIWSQGISRCTVAYGTARLSGSLSGGSIGLVLRLRITNVYGGYLDHRNFTVDDVEFNVLKLPPPQVESPAMNLLIT